MKIVQTAATVGALVLTSLALVPMARGDDWSRKSTITFSAPVEIPGVHLAGWGVLPAGTYVFRILDSASDRHIVQIFNKEETTVYATILAIPNYRLQATDKTVMTFRERAAGEPEALRAWFYPGHNWGEEFVYPKSKAVVLAQTTRTPVLYTPAELPMEVAEPVKLAEAPVIEQLKRAPVMAVQPTGEEVQMAQVVTPPPAAEISIAPAPVPGPRLPATASYMPLMGALGIVALIAGLAARSAARKMNS